MKTKRSKRLSKTKASKPKSSTLEPALASSIAHVDRPEASQAMHEAGKLSRRVSNTELLRLSRGIDLKTNKFSTLQYGLSKISDLKKRQDRSQPTVLDLFTRYAHTPLERAAAWFYNQQPPALLKACNDPVKAEFLFRHYYSALHAAIAIGWFTKGNKSKTPLWLFEHASYLIAMERTHLEMILSATKGIDSTWNGATWGKPIKIGDFAKLPKPDAQWFLNPPGGIDCWRSRFESWRNSANESFRYWVSTWCRDIADLAPDPAKAALFGALVHKSPLPHGFVDDLMIQLQKLHKDAPKAFYKNAAEPEPIFHGDVEIDTWLIEIWPLVTARRWNLRKVSELAGKRFDRNVKGSALDHSGIESRCEKLRLTLHVSQRKGGRPCKTSTESQSHELMAIWIKSVGMNSGAWLAGQRILGG